METKDHDPWRVLFSVMPEEALPADFHTKVMNKIHEKAALRKKRYRFWEIFGFTSGIATMLVTCVLAFYTMDISFELPELKPYLWTFPQFDFDLFTSPSFSLSLRIGVLAFVLLIIDLTIRRAIEKNRNKQY